MRISQLDVQIDTTVQTDTHIFAHQGLSESPVGLVVLGIEEAENAGWISRVFVQPESRRQGVAKTLITHAINLCREKGRAFVSLTVSEENEHAQQLYKSLGFEPFMKGQKGYVQYIKKL